MSNGQVSDKPDDEDDGNHDFAILRCDRVEEYE
jgi:hypothetical protein